MRRGAARGQSGPAVEACLAFLQAGLCLGGPWLAGGRGQFTVLDPAHHALDQRIIAEGIVIILQVVAEEPGNTLPLRNIPLGSNVHCVEMKPGKGAQIARAAGASVQLIAKEGQHVTLRLRSGEVRKVPADCRATLGEVSNHEHNLRSIGKAGAMRWRGVRPTVRGVVMNPVDHPHGGGEGRTSGGRHPVSPWGTPTKGYKTRTNKRTTKLIVRRRNASK